MFPVPLRTAGTRSRSYQVQSNRMTQAMYFILCPTWKELAQAAPDSPQKTEFVNKAYDALMCAPE